MFTRENVCDRLFQYEILWVCKDREKIRFRFEGQHRAASLHQASKQERIKADVRSDVDDLHPRPNESPQQDRFVTTHPAEAVQTEGKQPVQRGSAHPAIPNVYLPAPKRSVIQLVKQGRDHSFRHAHAHRDAMGALVIEPFARAQPALNQFDFRAGKQNRQRRWRADPGPIAPERE
jgi:hypothetical protein